MASIGYAHRPVALGRRAMVASAHPFASLAGVDVLREGGTVADAAVAVNAVLNVTQPYCCGVGGDIFCLYYEAKTRTIHFLNGAGRSGSRASLAEARRRGLSALPIHGPEAVSVPGCVRGWSMLLERFGSRPLGELLAPAIQYAERGVPITSLVSQVTSEYRAVIRDPEWHRVYVPEGRVPALGELFVQPDLAKTLHALAVEGPDLFYDGAVGRAIARRLEAEGFVGTDDLAAHTGAWGEPIGTTYRGLEIWETPPPTQGVAALLALNLLEGLPLSEWPVHSVDHLHTLLETVGLAYADRDRWIGDPEHVRVPVSALLSADYAARRRREFDRGRAQRHAWGNPEGDTTGFVIGDGRGNMISVIQSLFNGYGSGVVVPGTGIVLNNRGRAFRLEADHPASFAPHKRPFHTLMAALVTQDTEPVLGFATMGGQGQAMFHVQVLTNVIDYGMEIQEAIERPRFLAGPLTADDPAEVVRIESRVPPEVVDGLRARGHLVRVESGFYTRMGHAHGIVRRHGSLMGGADPRGDGAALGC